MYHSIGLLVPTIVWRKDGSDNGSYSCRADNEANIGAVLTTPYQLTVVERISKVTIINTITVYFFSSSS